MISTLGKQLQVDAVLIYYLIIFRDTDVNDSIDAFLIDVKAKNIYHAKDDFNCFPFEPTLSFKFVTDKVYADFEKDASK